MPFIVPMGKDAGELCTGCGDDSAIISRSLDETLRNRISLLFGSVGKLGSAKSFSKSTQRY